MNFLRKLTPRFSLAMRPQGLTIPYDYHDRAELLVHKDLRLQFDGNRYCVPQRYVGRRLMVKADSSSVTIYVHEIVSYPRSWRRTRPPPLWGAPEAGVNRAITCKRRPRALLNAE